MRQERLVRDRGLRLGTTPACGSGGSGVGGSGRVSCRRAERAENGKGYMAWEKCRGCTGGGGGGGPFFWCLWINERTPRRQRAAQLGS